ncbi:hypothetical protein GOBAR_DD27565 [Gossypium barbadense]|nr:hypothetical protein GOBAR_DD27565 [Gossypium barbadense]
MDFLSYLPAILGIPLGLLMFYSIWRKGIRSNAEKYLAYDHAGFGFAPHEPFWREMHKFTVVQLLSTHKLARLNHVRVSEVTVLMKDSYSFCKKKEQAILMCGSLKLNMILRLVTEKRYFSNAKVKTTRKQILAKAGPNDDQDFIDVMLSTMKDDIMCGQPHEKVI